MIHNQGICVGIFAFVMSFICYTVWLKNHPAATPATSPMILHDISILDPPPPFVDYHPPSYDVFLASDPISVCAAGLAAHSQSEGDRIEPPPVYCQKESSFV